MTKGVICCSIMARAFLFFALENKKGEIDGMKMRDRTALTAGWMKVRRLCDRGDAVARETAEALALVMADEDRSMTFKERQAARLQQEAAAEYARLGQQVWDTMSELDTLEAKIGGSGDYTSPRLAAALNVVRLLGDRTPDAVQRRIVQDFAGDELSLRCIKGAFDGAGVVNADVDRYLAPFTDLTNRAEEAAGELLAYATAEQASWRPAAVRAAAERAGAGWGLDFSVNPYLKEAEAIRESTTNKAKAAEIGRWIASHGGAVFEDGCEGNGPSQMAEACLDGWRDGEGEG